MSDSENIETASKDGEILLLKQELIFKSQCAEIFYRQMSFWRSKFLKERPDLDNWEYATNAYNDESGEGLITESSPSEWK
jgi:hypothetical protein